jgi:hypothetical protein
MVDLVLAMIVDCTNEDVTFVPDDPQAHDPVAANETDIDFRARRIHRR